MNTNTQDDSQDDRSVEAIKRIRHAINSMPYGDLISPILNNLELDPDIGRHEADGAIDDLVTMASLGDIQSVHHLAVLGCKIARALSGLIGNPKESHELAIPQISQPPETSSEICNYGNASKSSNFTEDITLAFSMPDWKLNEAAAEACENYPIELFHINIQDYISIFNSTQLTPQNHDNTTEDFQTQRPIERIFQSWINQRINRVSKNTARHAAAESWGWPIEASAMADDRSKTINKYITDIALGSAIPAMLDSRDGQGTGKAGSKRDFSISIFEKLNGERTKKRSQSHLQEFRHAEQNSKSEANSETSNDDELHSIWKIKNIWIRKAALLPEFTKEAASQEKWHEAAMAFAESICGGDFDNFEWPSCVKNRQGVNNPKAQYRTAKSSVSEILRIGLKALVK